MAPHLPPPELPDDAVAEILLRLPPDEPGCFFRASLVCKLWQRLLTDAAFLRRYRRFHRTPPLLGFFYTYVFRGRIIPFFTPTTPASPFPQPMLDCRPWGAGGDLTVWDPVTGAREKFCEPDVPSGPFSVAVLCAAAGCDHRDCQGGPFLVVWASTCSNRLAHVCVYSSQVGSWSTSASVRVGVADLLSLNRPAHVGDAIYFMLKNQMGARILKYDLVKHHLSVIEPPESCGKCIFIVPIEDGSLGVAGVRGSTSLYLWTVVEEGRFRGS
ncbi:uncharacterized protein LOC120653365 [Panicum virgatum]|uniref:uncharacterized protein LOC120653365 n=1 Tax=Panicum virgatum TaxID=38727 RepID=UPI0019D4F3F1|nr:uncharacterized protein LOC120653365 [Panicum virgatum]